MQSVRLATPQVRNSILRCDATVSVWRRHSREIIYHGAIFILALTMPGLRDSILRSDWNASIWRRNRSETACYGAMRRCPSGDVTAAKQHTTVRFSWSRNIGASSQSELGFRAIKGTHCRYRTAQDKRNAIVRWQAIAISNLSAWPLARNSFGALGYFVSVTASREV